MECRLGLVASTNRKYDILLAFFNYITMNMDQILRWNGSIMFLVLYTAQRKRNVYRAHILHALNVMCDRYVVAG